MRPNDAPAPASEDLPENRPRHHGDGIPGIDVPFPDPDMATIIVRYETDRLHFAPGLGMAQNSPVTCDDGGNITVELKEEPGYVQKIAFLSDQDSLRFQRFCAGKPQHCLDTQGHIEGTPFGIELFLPGEEFLGFILTNTYTDASSLGTFDYTVWYDISGSPRSPHDPQIRNQGTSGGALGDEKRLE